VPAGAVSKSPESLQVFAKDSPRNLLVFPNFSKFFQAFLWRFRGVSKGCKGKKEKRRFPNFRGPLHPKGIGPGDPGAVSRVGDPNSTWRVA
jgi:hypothetical protein